jgi:putative redox protein
MGESVIVRQNSQFETEVKAQDPHNPDDPEFYPAGDIHQLTPYGLLLAGLGSCTTIILHTYAQYHDVPLAEVEIHLEYDRIFADDCKDCEEIEAYEEQIDMQIALFGNLTPEERHRLFVVSKHCPIHKMLAQGITVKSQLMEGTEEGQNADT